MHLIFYCFHFEGLPLTLIEAQVNGSQCYISKGIDTSVDMGVGMVKFIRLHESAKYWANELNDWKESRRKINTKEIVERGYSSRIESEKFKDFYLDLFETRS